jgi:hypothetical protein
MALTRTQVEGYAKSAGFSGKDLDIAVAVAKAESGWNPKAHNAVPPDDSYGLWQINMLGSLGPDRRKRFGLKANSDLFDPATNAKAAHAVFVGSGWKAWTTYTRGTYKKYLSDSGDSSGSGGGGSITPETATANPVLGVGSAINAFGDTIFKTGANIGGVLVAIALVVLGIVLLSRNVLPAGKIAGAVKGVLK